MNLRMNILLMLVFVFGGFVLGVYCFAQDDSPQTHIGKPSLLKNGKDEITNSQFAFKFNIPKELNPVPYVENMFFAENGRVKLKVWGEYNDIEKTLQEEFDWALGNYANTDVTYKALGKKYFVISGIEGDQVFYLKEILVTQKDEQIFISFRMEFPKTEKDTWDPILEDCVKTFGPAKGIQFVSKKEFYANYEALSGDRLGLPSMSFKVVPGDGSAKITWPSVSGAIGYELSVSDAAPGSHDLLKQENLPKDATETVVEHLTNGKTYEFGMRPIYRSGKGGECISFGTSGPEKKFATVSHMKIISKNGFDGVGWDPEPDAGAYFVYVSQDGKCFKNLTRYGTQLNGIAVPYSTSETVRYYAVGAKERGFMGPSSDWVIQQAVSGSVSSPNPVETVVPELTICPTPYPDSNDYQVAKIIDLTKEKDGYDGKLMLWLGKEKNSHWKTGDSEQYEWHYLKPMIQLVDASGNEESRQYYEFSSPTVDLEEVNPVENGLPVYLIRTTNEADDGTEGSFSRILQITDGKLDYLTAQEMFADGPHPVAIFLETGQAGMEAGNWKWVPSKIAGNQDILSWTSVEPKGSIMAPDTDTTPSTDYVRYHFDGRQWVSYKNTEEGFVEFSEKMFPAGDWFPDEALFPKVP